MGPSQQRCWSHGSSVHGEHELLTARCWTLIFLAPLYQSCFLRSPLINIIKQFSHNFQSVGQYLDRFVLIFRLHNIRIRQQKQMRSAVEGQERNNWQDCSASDFEVDKLLGKGTFGTVFLARWKTKQCEVALKIVPNNPKYKNREVDILKSLNHPSIVPLLRYYENTDEQKKKSYSNIVMEYLPSTLSSVIKQAQLKKSQKDMAKIILYSKKMLEGLAYLESRNICHRDIKPSNVLINQETSDVKLCDFGSAKILKKGEKSITYICSRYYRAPELILECSEYSTKVDMWSMGCVIAEMVAGKALFSGSNNMDQIIKIVKVLGTPAEQDYAMMKVDPKKNQLMEVAPIGIQKKIKTLCLSCPQALMDLLSKILVYDPVKRLSARQALEHPVFKLQS